MDGQAAQRRLDGDSFMLSPNMNVKGSPFLFDDFQEAILTDVKGSEIEELMVNYDAMNEALICWTGKDQYLQLNKYIYSKMVIGNESYYNLNAFGALGFGRALYMGDRIKCFEKTEAIKSTSNSSGYNEVKSYYKIVKRSRTLIWVDGVVHEVHRRAKDFENLFSGIDVKRIIKTNKLKIKKDEGLVDLIKTLEKEM